MKVGKSINELAAEITRQAQSKKDYLAPTTALMVVDKPEGVRLSVADKGEFPVTPITHGQIAEHVKVPKVYYDRMLEEAPDLLATNVNRWFQKYPAVRQVRTLDNRARAFLSDRFALLDNYDFANAALPLIKERNLEVVSCEITERRLYLKVIDRQEFQVPVGYRMGDGSHKIFDVCAPALILANSEIGFGRLVVDTGTYTKACTNLVWFSDGGFKRTHIGARHKLLEETAGIDLEEILSVEAKQKTQEALWLQVRDVVASAFDKKVIEKRTERLIAAGENQISVKAIDKVTEIVQEKFGLNQTEGASVLEHLVAGGNLSQYGLHAAITRAAQDAADYDRSTELEYVGGKVLDLTRSEWEATPLAA
jgi:hypothetical protein